MSTNFSCTAIFCDDIRHEINGKVSLMGIYASDMYVPSFPVTLPKVCAFFELRVSLDFVGKADAILTVMKGSEKINSITLRIGSEHDRKINHGKPHVFRRTTGAMEFPAVTFSEPTLLEVAVEIDGHATIGGRLWVTTFPQGDTASSGANP